MVKRSGAGKGKLLLVVLCAAICIVGVVAAVAYRNQTMESTPGIGDAASGNEEGSASVSVDAPSQAAPADSRQAEQISAPGAAGGTMNNDRLDSEVKKIIDKVCDPSADAQSNLSAAYNWIIDNIYYKAAAVDVSEGYHEELIGRLAEYGIINRRGSCEHIAALMYTFAKRLGCDVYLAEGFAYFADEYGDDTNWGPHVWVIAKADGSYRHFDPLYERYYGNVYAMYFTTIDAEKLYPRCFMKTDAQMESIHRWNRESYPACD